MGKGGKDVSFTDDSLDEGASLAEAHQWGAVGANADYRVGAATSTFATISSPRTASGLTMAKGGLAHDGGAHDLRFFHGRGYRDIDRNGQVDFFVADMSARIIPSGTCNCGGRWAWTRGLGLVRIVRRVSRNTLQRNRGDGTREIYGQRRGRSDGLVVVPGLPGRGLGTATKTCSCADGVSSRFPEHRHGGPHGCAHGSKEAHPGTDIPSS